MGIWQNLTTSYDQNAHALKLSYPLSTTTITNNSGLIAIIVIDGNGNFIRFDKIDKANPKKGIDSQYVSIPVTESSMARSSGVAPHPVFDQFVYLKGEGKKFEAFIAQLKSFAESESATDQIRSIYHYAAKCCIASDLSDMNLKDKTNIIFQVETSGDPLSKVWENKAFFDAWHQYYVSIKDDVKLLDYITGDKQVVAKSHPKKICNSSANSKLISDNDKQNFTFRGKFRHSSEAISIGYETSQKAHQFLRYLVNDRGHHCGEQVILSFTIGSLEHLLPPPIGDTSIWASCQEYYVKTQNDVEIELRSNTGFDYAKALQNSLRGYGASTSLEQHVKTAVIALDAATNGRLAITFYRELDRFEYLEKISKWHSHYKWHQTFWSKELEKDIHYMAAPSIDKIIEAIYGKPRGGKDESYAKIKKLARERLIRCVFDGSILPFDYVVAAVRRASNPLGITKNGKFDRWGFNQVISTACALVRRPFSQSKQEDYKLSIEHDRSDRDYLYGRLLGAADKLEEYALYKKDNNRNVTAAIRHMQTFAQHPYRTWQTIHGCLNPYIQKVKDSFAFQEIQTISNLFKSGDYELDVPLKGSYLIGYYHERAHIDYLIKQTQNDGDITINQETENGNDGERNTK